ncbi:MAG: PleD family two-component system response regulator [Alphaproteobacteria bacterium]
MSARVLVVDDLPPNVKLLEAKLSAEYFDVITAHDGESALAAAESAHPDVILLDVMMPGMDGFEVCRRLKANRATMHVPVVMVTALSEKVDRLRGLEAGADDFLTKPVNDTALFARIKSLSRLKMMMDEWWRREATCDRFGVMCRASPLMEVDATNARLLVVDGSDLLAQKLSAAVAKDHTTIERARDAAEAEKFAQAVDYDVFVVGRVAGATDADALRLCSKLRADVAARQTPVLIIVDEDNTALLVRAIELGVQDYVVKPVDPNEFLARVRTQIRWKRYQERLRSNYERSLSLALTDSLTGLYNHRYANVHLATLLKQMSEGTKSVGVLMIDIDFFKAINDDHGHGAGDEVLREIANRLANGVRSFDMVARLGGEEFLVILNDAPAEVVARVAERLRSTCAEEPFQVSDPPKCINVTISVGGVLSGSASETPESILKRADEALYEAKRQGRNRIVLDFEVDWGDALTSASL